MVRHCFDREGHLVQLKLPRQNHSADLLNEVFERVSILGQKYWVIQVEAAVSCDLLCAIVVISVNVPALLNRKALT